MNVIPQKLKYELYEQAVQCHENDIEFMNREFRVHRERAPHLLREDFGGTGAMACDWVKQGINYSAWAIDLDPEPQAYGMEHHFSRLTKTEQDRMKFIRGNVLEPYAFKADIIAAFNFSYFIFKKRTLLVDYFKKTREGLVDDGVLFLDIFGGTECHQEMVEETEHDDFTYFWDCDAYNPITSEVQYYIHFKTHQDKVKYEKAFSYDWRMWGLTEVIDALYDAGYSKVIPYWEEDDDDGGGNGHFYQADKAEHCESWVTYLVALK
jgi:hypothetical protein